jgi:ABC transport system ATP-binding/permease protein
MATLEGEVKRLNARLADPALYARDRASFDKATAALATAQTELAAAEERWLELELLRSELEGS